MALQTNQILAVGGSTVTMNSAAGGPHTVDCSSKRTFLIVANASGGSINVTLTTPGTDKNGNAIADVVIAVADGARTYIPLDPDVYGAIATVAFSSSSSVTQAVVVLP